MRRLSNRATWIWKFALPLAWIGGFGAATLFLFIGPESEGMQSHVKWVFLCSLFIGTTVIYWRGIRVKKVYLDESDFVISGYIEELRVPVKDVKRVSGSILWRPELVSLHFRTATPFGKKIVFITPTRLFGGFRVHPIVAELDSIVKASSGA